MELGNIAKLHIATWYVTAFVGWGVWNGQTDSFPLNESQARPGWYAYGWPVCFANCSPDRLDVVHFDRVALIVDLAVAGLIILCTACVCEMLISDFPQITLRNLVTLLGGASIVFAVWSDNFHWLLSFAFGAFPPAPNVSVVAGNAQPASRLAILVAGPLTIGVMCSGVAVVDLLFTLCQKLFQCIRGTINAGGTGK